MEKRRLPIGLIGISAFLILIGILSLFYAFLVFRLTGSISHIGLSQFPVTTIILLIFLLLIGLLNIILGYKLFKLSKIARRIILVLCIVWALSGYGTRNILVGIANSVIWFVIYCYLRLNKKAKTAFE